MDSTTLQELLDAVNAQGGGLVLKQGDKPQAVVLSVPKYQDLLAASKKGEGEPREDKKAEPEQERRILVTGGAGYIGSHTVRELLAVGAKVVVLDNLSSGKKENLPGGVVLVEGDVRDRELVEKTLKEHNIDTIMHLAALVEVEESTKKPAEYLDVNLRGTVSVLEAASKAGVQNFIFSSTAAVYGNQDTSPIPEIAPTSPVDPYGTSKLLAEQLIAYYSEFLGIKATVLRYFNVCGGVKEWDIKDAHISHLIPVVMEVVQGRREKIVVHGSDYATPDGSPVRDYVNVRDIARAHLAALKDTGQAFRVYNVGTGRGYSVKEVINMAAEVTGRMIPMEIGPRRAGDAAQTVANASLIKRELDFDLKFSDLETMIRDAWEMEK